MRQYNKEKRSNPPHISLIVASMAYESSIVLSKRLNSCPLIVKTHREPCLVTDHSMSQSCLVTVARGMSLVRVSPVRAERSAVTALEV
jgi:hypothetical protein